MKKKNILKQTLAAVMVAGLFASGVSANMRKDDSKMLKDLSLVGNQQKRIDDINKAQRDKTKELSERADAAQEKLVSALKNNAADDDVRQAREELKSVVNEMIDQRTDSTLAVRNVLNPEQRRKFNDLKSKQEARKGKGKWEQHYY